MPLITDPIQAREIYRQAAEAGICLVNFCTENRRTTEATFRAAHDFAQTALHGQYMEKYQVDRQVYPALADINHGL